jgi:ubiquinone/menaquinone biosynthesis C-methylase UbiE
MQPEYRVSAEKTWDAIAESFDLTRQKPWKFCLDFISSLKNSDIVADIGCGNGRHLLPCAHNCSHAIGVDISQKLLRIVQNKLSNKHIINVSLIHADVVQLPLADNSLNAVLFIASLHNIKGKEHRFRALQEVGRVLKPNGVALISVWSRWQDMYWRYFMKQFIVRSREFGDIDVFWKQHTLNLPRFYHLYSRREFQRELHDAHFYIQDIQSVKIHSKRFPDNTFAIVEKR